MKEISAVVTAVLVGMVTVEAQAQRKPDFSGTWTQVSSSVTAASPGARTRAAGAADLASGWGRTITVKQDTATLTVEYRFFRTGDMQPSMKFIFALDGSERSNRVMMGRGIQEQVSRTRWQGDTLLVTTTHHITEPDIGRAVTIETRRRLWLHPLGWQMSPDFTSLVLETTRSGVFGGQPTTTRAIFRKL